MLRGIVFWISLILSFVFGTATGKFETLTEEEQTAIIMENIDDFNRLAEASIGESTNLPDAMEVGESLKQSHLNVVWLKSVMKRHEIKNKEIRRNIIQRIELKYLDDENVVVIYSFNMDAQNTFDSDFYYSQNDTPYDPWAWKEPELEYDDTNDWYIKNTQPHPYITYKIADNWYFSKRVE